MLYALRKLIALVFLVGIAWFVYGDIAYVLEPQFQLTLGTLIILFAATWLFVPPVVVLLRAGARRKRNQAGYRAWRASLGEAGLRPLTIATKLRHQTKLTEEERVYFLEKGTLYGDSSEGFGDRQTRTGLGNVAFPFVGGKWYRAQRVRVWLTDQRILFVGKDLTLSWPRTENLSFRVTVGGIIFTMRGEKKSRRLAFTLSNPLIVAKILSHK